MKGPIVIVGANLAGGRAAETLRAEGFDGRIVLVGEEPNRPYERPPLSKEILRTEWESAEKAFLRPEEWYRDNGVEMRLGVRATAIDPEARVVALSAAEMIGAEIVGYEALLLATGGAPRALDVPGAASDGVFTLRTMEDALAIRMRLQPGAPVVVVGAGFIGSEVAASAKTIGCDVTVLEVLDVPLSRALGAELGAICGEIHRERGVRLLTGTGIEGIESGRDGLRVLTTRGEALEAACVVVGIGITPNIALARDAGIEVANGVIVNERCETSVPGVFAAGDVAEHPNPILGERIRVEHWQNAQNQGAAAARNMLGRDEPFAEVPWFWSDQYDLNLQMAGHPSGWDRIVYRGDVEARSFCAFLLRGERLVAAFGINRGKDVRAARIVIEKRLPVDPKALADESVDLRKLAAAP